MYSDLELLQIEDQSFELEIGHKLTMSENTDKKQHPNRLTEIYV